MHFLSKTEGGGGQKLLLMASFELDFNADKRAFILSLNTLLNHQDLIGDQSSGLCFWAEYKCSY